MSNKRTEVLFPITLEEMRALSDLVHDRKSVRFNPDRPWTAEKALAFRQRVDAELALLEAETEQQTKPEELAHLNHEFFLTGVTSEYDL